MRSKRLSIEFSDPAGLGRIILDDYHLHIKAGNDKEAFYGEWAGKDRQYAAMGGKHNDSKPKTQKPPLKPIPSKSLFYHVVRYRHHGSALHELIVAVLGICERNVKNTIILNI